MIVTSALSMAIWIKQYGSAYGTAVTGTKSTMADPMRSTEVKWRSAN